VQYRAATAEDLAETVRQVEALDRRIISGIADVRDAASLRSIVDDGVARLGRLDTIVANAGISTTRVWDEVTEALWDEMIGINLTGVWNTIRIGVPHLIAAGGGSVILTSSSAGLKGMPFLTHYVAAKHGVVGLMRGFASELSDHNIRVNSLHPCGVETEMTSDAAHGHLDPALAAHPRLAPMFTNMLDVRKLDPIDVSHAVVYLASDESRGVTSTALPVDLGNTQF
jgi:NAD(P)-dependent dehydrogenase (short-subunit alcohol dehydrogenase family)